VDAAGDRLRTALVTGATDGIGFELGGVRADPGRLALAPRPWVFHARRRVEAGQAPEKLAQ
jgi:NAD(P)-dependent dehydrogenase (short-subunit alcohol dehydrogenase family)